MSIYDINVKGRTGEEISLNDYKGKVLLIVNTATGCGFTPQYEALEKMYEEDKGKGLEILDFPCNQFGNQAPGTEDEIHEFCTLKYNTSFPRFKKIEVNGENEDELFKFLKSQKSFAGFSDDEMGHLMDDMLSKQDPNYKNSSDIKWNFTKFLVSRNGEVLKRFEPTLDMAIVKEEVEKVL